MTSTLDDDELALSVHPSHTRRGSSRGTSQDGGAEVGNAAASTAAEARSAEHQSQQAGHSSQSLTGRASQRLGQYQILKTLGEGSFGKVKLAVHQTTGQKVALKIISRRKLMARDMAGRVEREIQYLQLLRHPHIIKLYTVITFPSEIIMVLEYAGSELFNYIVDHGKMAEDKARQFFQQIVCAVEYCHRHKIVHRDLKPENLLLDDGLHVKIADFGLSNIMTDGNFLKTSCGSPNYAAPEVISGKLYAGPEVDVWSCGVILYVLLCGRLPFDDEYIPALFKKIASGSYTIPTYLSPGANKLIRKMLQVSPVMRYTVQEIRQDPWFVKDLPLYLQPQVEDFIDTGVDPNKAIDPRDLAPSKPAAMQERLHESVVGKLGKTMGYGREDVQQALKDEEPNAIKDAYLIVRENQIMRTTPSLVKDPSLQPFLAQSPPAFQTHSPIAATMMEGLDAPGRGTPPSPLRDTDRPRLNSTTSGHIAEARSPVSSIGVLPSSLPDFHQASMRGQPKPSAAVESQNESPGRQTSEQQAATARRLKPHSRSSLSIDKGNRPEGLTPIQPVSKKPRPTKWQFGIRSRNQPAEAMLAIYKALRAMGAEWEIPKARKAGGGSSGDASPRDGSPDATQSDDGDSSDSGGHERESARQHGYDSDSDLDDDGRSTSSWSVRGCDRDGESKANRYNSKNDWGYLVPQDPWIINARFRKGDMYAPGVAHPTSAHSSRVDLVDRPVQRHRASSAASSASTAPSAAGSDSGVNAGTANATTAAPGRRPESAHSLYSAGSRAGSRRELVGGGGGDDSPAAGDTLLDDSAYVYLTIQLYSIEKEFYLVDFKCAGYERLVRSLVVRAGGPVSQSDTDTAEDAAGDDDGDADEDDDGEERTSADNAPAAPQMESKDFAPAPPPPTRMRTSATPTSARGPTHEELVGQGRATEEKDVSSPFPFLDVASRLIIQLAEAE